MIVVSNTSPLTNLAAIGQFELLRRLYDQVHIVQGVWEELNAGGKRWPGCTQVAQASWVERHNLDALRQTAGFYISASLYQHALTLAKETNEQNDSES